MKTNPQSYLKIDAMRETNAKYDDLLRKKHSSSFHALELNKQRLRRLEIAYRNISEKKYKSKSNERSRREKSDKENKQK